ncbi:MAG: hypothetical protein ACREMV_09530 [Gemmatimonadales bacterium]
MTLGRLILAWLPVAVLFVLFPLGRWFYGLKPRADPETRPPPEVEGRVWVFTKWDVIWRVAEAGVLTLFASLWFDSLGHGGWWLLFLFVGLLAAFPMRLQGLRDVPPALRRPRVIEGVIDTVRYVIAGALLAWRLA